MSVTFIEHSGVYASAGAASAPFDISGLSGDFTLRLTIESLTASKKVLLAIQDSADNFVGDVKTLAVLNTTGGTGSKVPQAYSARAYQMPSLRLGVASAQLRVIVQSIDTGASATVSLTWEQ